MPKPITSKTVNGTLGADTLYGDTSGTAGDDFGPARPGGKQTINGLAGDDSIYGDASSMSGRAMNYFFFFFFKKKKKKNWRERHPQWW